MDISLPHVRKRRTRSHTARIVHDDGKDVLLLAKNIYQNELSTVRLQTP